MGCATAYFVGPAPGALEWAKRSNMIKYHKLHLQSQFQRFLNQTLFVYLQMKDMEHFRQDFNLVARVMPHRWDLGVLWGVGGHNFLFRNSTRVGV